MNATTSSGSPLYLGLSSPDSFADLLYANKWSVLAITAFCCLTVQFLHTREARKLSHIPTVGPTFPLIAWLSTYKFYKAPRETLNHGLSKWSGGIFKIGEMTRWLVIVSDPRHIDELRKAPENVLSCHEAVNEDFQTDLTLGKHLRDNQYHLPIIHGQLTRSIPELLPDIYDEMVYAYDQFIPQKDDWISISGLETSMKLISRISNRAIVGLPLCRDSDFVDTAVKFAEDVGTIGLVLRSLPEAIRPIVNTALGVIPKDQERVLKHLLPFITQRRQEREAEAKVAGNTSMDFLSWSMDAAEGVEKEEWYLASRVLMANFAAIHTTSMTFCQTLFNLASHPEYLEPLRQEVEEAIHGSGWTKAAIDKMVKIDSFIKETQRLTPMALLMMPRIAVQDYTFSDGTKIPAGTMLSVCTDYNQRDAAVYSDALSFDGFRFAKLRRLASVPHESTAPGAERKFDLTSTGPDFVAFGSGRHACPGRWFAACELKLMLAYLVITYDVKLEGDSVVRPPDFLLGGRCIPNMSARVALRKRQML